MPQVHTQVFASRVGTGVQTVNGIVDKDGAAFTPSLIIFIHTESVVNTLDWGDDLSNSLADNRGMARLGQGASGSIADIGRFGVKTASTGFGSGRSLLDLQADLFFGGNFQGQGYVSDIRSGEFDITWTQQNRGGYAILMTCFGGSDMTLEVIQNTLNGLHTTTDVPQGIFFWGAFNGMGNVPGSAVIGGGGNSILTSFDTRDGNRGIAAYTVANQGSNSRGTSTTRSLSNLTVAPAWSNTGLVSAWGANSYTISGYGSSSNAALVFQGANIKVATGSFRAKATTGSQTITTGVKAKWLVLVSTGTPPSATPFGSSANFSMGWADGTRQGCMWVGETSNHNVNPINGARYLSDSQILRLGTAARGSTTFQNIAEVTDISDFGTFTVNWITADGSEPEVLWFVVGEAADVMGTVQIAKVWSDTVGQTVLQLGTTPDGSDVAYTITGEGGALPLTLGPISLAAGTYYISEAFPYLWALVVTATKNGVAFIPGLDGSFTVANGDVVLFTLTNGPLAGSEIDWKLYRADIKTRREARA